MDLGPWAVDRGPWAVNLPLYSVNRARHIIATLVYELAIL